MSNSDDESDSSGSVVVTMTKSPDGSVTMHDGSNGTIYQQSNQVRGTVKTMEGTSSSRDGNSDGDSVASNDNAVCEPIVSASKKPPTTLKKPPPAVPRRRSSAGASVYDKKKPAAGAHRFSSTMKAHRGSLQGSSSSDEEDSKILATPVLKNHRKSINPLSAGTTNYFSPDSDDDDGGGGGDGDCDDKKVFRSNKRSFGRRSETFPITSSYSSDDQEEIDRTLAKLRGSEEKKRSTEMERSTETDEALVDHEAVSPVANDHPSTNASVDHKAVSPAANDRTANAKPFSTEATPTTTNFPQRLVAFPPQKVTANKANHSKQLCEGNFGNQSSMMDQMPFDNNALSRAARAPYDPTTNAKPIARKGTSLVVTNLPPPLVEGQRQSNWRTRFLDVEAKFFSGELALLDKNHTLHRFLQKQTNTIRDLWRIRDIYGARYGEKLWKERYLGSNKYGLCLDLLERLEMLVTVGLNSQSPEPGTMTDDYAMATTDQESLGNNNEGASPTQWSATTTASTIVQQSSDSSKKRPPSNPLSASGTTAASTRNEQLLSNSRSESGNCTHAVSTGNERLLLNPRSVSGTSASSTRTGKRVRGNRHSCINPKNQALHDFLCGESDRAMADSAKMDNKFLEIHAKKYAKGAKYLRKCEVHISSTDMALQHFPAGVLGKTEGTIRRSRVEDFFRISQFVSK